MTHSVPTRLAADLCLLCVLVLTQRKVLRSTGTAALRARKGAYVAGSGAESPLSCLSAILKQPTHQFACLRPKKFLAHSVSARATRRSSRPARYRRLACRDGAQAPVSTAQV